MSSPIVRRVLLALTAAGAIAGAIGACGGDNAASGGDMGGGADGFNGGSDMGAAGDGGLASIKVSLSTPAPWQSYVDTSTQFDFLAMLPGGGTPQMLEPYVQIAPHPMGTALAGAFSWKSTGPSMYQLSFLPAALADSTDYVVTVANPQNTFGPPLLKCGISTGSNPRVVNVKLTVAAHADSVGALVTFSEPMLVGATMAGSVLKNLVITAGGVAVPATVAQQAGSSDQLAFQIDVTSPHNLTMPVVVSVSSGATAATMMQLNPKSWDSNTDDGNGNFVFTPVMPPASFDNLTADTTYEFTPTVN
jgi:hypothetical protein